MTPKLLITKLSLICCIVIFLGIKTRAEEIYHIGATLPLSGAWAKWGEDIRNGLILSSRTTKNKFSFDFQDDQCNGRVALGNMKKFESIDHLSTIFSGCVEILEAIRPNLNQQIKTVITLGGMEKRILKDNPAITSFSSLTDSEAYFLVPHLIKNTNIDSIALVNGTNLFGETLGASMEALLANTRIKITGRHSVDLETSDFKSIISKIMARHSDAIWIHQGDTTMGTLLRQLQSAGFKGEIFTVSTLENLPLNNSNPSWLQGVKYTFPSESSKFTKEIQKFNEDYLNEFDTPIGATSKIAYDALQVLDNAISECGEIENSCINKYLRSLNKYQGLSGKVTIYPDGSAIRPHGLKEFRDGKFVWLKKQLAPIVPN